MIASVNSRGLDMLLAMARASRRRRPALATAVAVVAFALIVVPLVVVASDGVPHDEDDALWQGPWPELMLLAGWALLAVAALCLLGLRPRQADGYMFARVPGARLWLAYLISLFFTGIAAAMVTSVCGVMLSTPRDLSDADGVREAFGWLFIRGVLFMAGGTILTGAGLVVAVIALAVVTSVQRRRGIAAKHEAAGARFMVGVLALVLLVIALPISVFSADNPTRRLVFGLACAGLIGLTTAALLWIGRRADRQAEAAGAPNWTHGIVRTRMRPEAYAIIGGFLMMFMVWFVVAAAGANIPDAEILFACGLTDCSSVGLTIAGWLIVALPAALVIAAAVFWRRLVRPARIALLLTTLLLCGNGALFFPGGKRTFSGLADGAGSEPVIGGLGWAVAGVAAVAVWSLVAVLLGTKHRAFKSRPMVALTSVALLVMALAMAIVRAEPSLMRAEENFPATLKMNGDTLTRTMARNQRGCDGILLDDTRLNAQECLLTVHAAYTTDDSDVVVTISATHYRDLSAARTVHTGLGADVRLAGVSGEVLTDSLASFTWVVITAAGHADGRPILPDEQSWVRWPMRQVLVQFINTRVGGHGEPKPNSTSSPKAPGM